MATNFPSRVSHIKPGEPVSASVASRPDRALESRTNYLLRLLESIDQKLAVIHYAQPVDPNVQVGQAVYWNTTNYRYEAALATVTTDPDGNIVYDDRADVAGMVLSKPSSDLADVVLFGIAKFDDLTQAVEGGTVTPGRYYLSSTSDGKLTQQRPPATVSVCRILGPLDKCDQASWVLVHPQQRDFLEDHVHYQVELVARPAGDHTPPTSGNPHTITNPDSTKQGWLPASDAVFNGKAPAGAKFGYNLSQHPELAALWPPVPLGAVVLEWQKTSTDNTTYMIGGRVPPEKVVFDRYGIWWMTDCYDEVPWPTNLDTSTGYTPPDPAACPQGVDMHLTLSFIKLTFQTDKSVVTSLEPYPGTPLVITDLDGNQAKTGALQIKWDGQLLEDTDETLGGEVLKGVSSDGKLLKGWAVEGVIPLSNRVVVSSDRQRLLDPSQPYDASTNPYVHQGILQLDFDPNAGELEILPQVVALGDAVTRELNGVLYIGFPDQRDSEIRAKFLIPPTGLPTGAQWRIRALIFGRGDGQLTDLDTAYSVIARPSGGSGVPLPTSDIALNMATSITVVADNVYEVESDPVTANAGDTVLFKLARSASGTPSYSYEIGVVRLSLVIS